MALGKSAVAKLTPRLAVYRRAGDPTEAMGFFGRLMVALGLAKKKVRRRIDPPSPPSPPRDPRCLLIHLFEPSSLTHALVPPFVPKQRSLLVMGLANGGKTTLVNNLKPEKDRDPPDFVAPTVGFNVERFTLNKCKLTVVDMSGQGRYHELWECYYKDTQAIIFVVDAASSEEQLEESRQMLGNMLSHEDLKGTPLLVFANKSDLPAAKGAAAIAGDIDLTGAVCDSRAWHIGACSALTGDGLDDGIKWLLGKV